MIDTFWCNDSVFCLIQQCRVKPEKAFSLISPILHDTT